MADAFDLFGGIDFSGAREPLSNLWSAIGVEADGRLTILDVRPHAFRADLGGFVRSGWRTFGNGAAPERILWGADFPFGLPEAVSAALGAGTGWPEISAWVADRPPEEVRESAGPAARSLRSADTAGALAPLDLRLYKQTVEGIRWVHQLLQETEVNLLPQAPVPTAAISLIEVYPFATVQELGLPRRRTPSRPGEARARAAALRTYLDFTTAGMEALAVTLEDAWDAVIACLTAFLCRRDLEQPMRVGRGTLQTVQCEGWIYRPPASLK